MNPLFTGFDKSGVTDFSFTAFYLDDKGLYYQSFSSKFN